MLWILAGILILIFLDLLKAILGPTAIDRLLSINAITSKIIVMILMIAFTRIEYGFVDIAIVFMLCSFVSGLWILNVITPDNWKFKTRALKNLESDEKEGIKND
ncbi:MAG: hypothetical protein GX957_09295 [Clostridiaceae bacterium]|nr:hypothetical protein [Clostridiaceae bacterium]